MKNKNLIIFFVVICVLILIFFIFSTRKSDTEVIDNITENNSISEISDNDILNADFNFGEFTNQYIDDDFDFSLMYPEELGVAQVQKSCDISLYLKKPSYPPFLLIQNPNCDSAFRNPNAKSLDDYKKDYVTKSGGIVHIFNSEEIKTNFGTIGIKQKYHKFQNEEEINNINFNDITPSVRYVFHNEIHGFYILYVMPTFSENEYLEEKTNIYLDLEKKIINTIKY
ncbi:hypothetical protein A3E89_00730 [Candidatus Campbellbacteria bacterium RIFCSPHIGHO2_12_FULL_35_10]|nr:MAG: hypothetical protein A3E89_00730 [Candidatus Campbellbacteria bacterium RIFCSPHIGHO2_12_FULL_35_10]